MNTAKRAQKLIIDAVARFQKGDRSNLGRTLIDESKYSCLVI